MYRYQEYEQAAQKLKTMGRYNECVACYYSALLHRMMLGLVSDTDLPMTYDELNPPGEDTHLKVRQIIERRKLQGFSESKRRERDNFRDDLDVMYEFRKKADYGNIDLTMNDVLECEDLYNRLINKVRNYYPVPFVV